MLGEKNIARKKGIRGEVVAEDSERCMSVTLTVTNWSHFREISRSETLSKLNFTPILNAGRTKFLGFRWRKRQL